MLIKKIAIDKNKIKTFTWRVIFTITSVGLIAKV